MAIPIYTEAEQSEMSQQAPVLREATIKPTEVEPPSVIRGSIPVPPVFQDKKEEREWLKFRLAQTLRIFGKNRPKMSEAETNILVGEKGYDEGVAGHITVRVSYSTSYTSFPP